MRKFEFVKRLENIEGLKLPQRSTKYSAGYDFYAIEDITIEPSIGRVIDVDSSWSLSQIAFREPFIVKTGIKVKMANDDVLLVVNRSSNPGNKGLIIPNDIGVIDADYYENETNDGEIAFLFYNISSKPVTIKKGDKLGQGIFVKYFTTNSDDTTNERIGGFGSTGK